MKIRIGDYVRIVILLIGMLTLSLSYGVALYAQNVSTNDIHQHFKDIENQQRNDQEKVNFMDKRLSIIETKQDFLLYLVSGLAVGIGALLLERFRNVFFESRRRRYDEHN